MSEYIPNIENTLEFYHHVQVESNLVAFTKKLNITQELETIDHKVRRLK